ncbi:hypothetical protein GGX14DRAFT_608673 [Mycena pura]|uniref:Thioester reductase (TE) domain-containing protein n=1 Tax=Mycena pura TaxID=153505 RepID=A0AAD6VNS4_9AGAR|nr:hypothetical protein GGX14DRAFT_608673 [Mycena pura]
MNAAPVALEQQITDPHTVLRLGYTESKWVAEQILEAAASQTTLNLKAVIIRLGQLCAVSPSGFQLFCIRVSCLERYQFCMPYAAYSIQQVMLTWRHLSRVNDAARIIVNMSNSAERYHLTHPHLVPTRSVLSHIWQLFFLPLIPFAGWLFALEVAVSNAATNPGCSFHM